jgi:hypothetical protein
MAFDEVHQVVGFVAASYASAWLAASMIIS